MKLLNEVTKYDLWLKKCELYPFSKKFNHYLQFVSLLLNLIVLIKVSFYFLVIIKLKSKNRELVDAGFSLTNLNFLME